MKSESARSCRYAKEANAASKRAQYRIQKSRVSTETSPVQSAKNALLIAARLLQREWREQQVADEPANAASAKDAASRGEGGGGGAEARGVKEAGATLAPSARPADTARPSPISRSAAAQKAYEILKADADADADAAASLSSRQARARGGGAAAAGRARGALAGGGGRSSASRGEAASPWDDADDEDGAEEIRSAGRSALEFGEEEEEEEEEDVWGEFDREYDDDVWDEKDDGATAAQVRPIARKSFLNCAC